MDFALSNPYLKYDVYVQLNLHRHLAVAYHRFVYNDRIEQLIDIHLTFVRQIYVMAIEYDECSMVLKE